METNTAEIKPCYLQYYEFNPVGIYFIIARLAFLGLGLLAVTKLCGGVQVQGRSCTAF